MKAVSRVHITPHMHWDREWYFTTEESRILLVNNMEEILCRLEQDNEYKYYVLDGQTAILEDYFAVKLGKQRPREETGRSRQVDYRPLVYPCPIPRLFHAAPPILRTTATSVPAVPGAASDSGYAAQFAAYIAC